MRTCKLCPNPVKTRGLCDKHYQRIRYEGRLDEVADPPQWDKSTAHRLSNIDKETLTAECSGCSRHVAVQRRIKNGSEYFECSVKKAERARGRDHKKSNGAWYFKGVEGWHPELKKELWEAQQGKCAICFQDTSLEESRLDHCHKTKKVREVLCHGCNVGIGFLKDDEEILKSALAYLKKFR